MEEEEEEGAPEAKRRKVEKTGKSYQGSCKALTEYKEDVRILRKLCAIYPEIEEKTKVIS